jgi:hypothetical protein
MDLNNYWQENKRFLTSVGVGLAVFLVGWYSIDSTFGVELRGTRATRTRREADLRQPMFAATDLDRAKAQQEQLVSACVALRSSVEFVARPQFRLEKGQPATSRYFSVLERTRDELKRLASRSGLALPLDLGMPAVAPTKDAELARYLEALDALDQVVHAATRSGVSRIDQLRVKLDPRLLSGRPFNDLEKTLVEVRLIGPALPLVRLVATLQDPGPKGDGRTLLVERCDIEPARLKNEHVRMELVLALVHTGRVGVLPEVEVAP